MAELFRHWQSESPVPEKHRARKKPVRTGCTKKRAVASERTCHHPLSVLFPASTRGQFRANSPGNQANPASCCFLRTGSFHPRLWRSSTGNCVPRLRSHDSRSSYTPSTSRQRSSAIQLINNGFVSRISASIRIVDQTLSSPLDLLRSDSWSSRTRDFSRTFQLSLVARAKPQADSPLLDSGFTGCWEQFEPAKTLDVALRLQPDTRHAVVVGGVSSFDRQSGINLSRATARL